MGKQDSIDDFRKYDFAKDERFKAYLSRFEATDAAAENRLKAKYYKTNIDPNFELAWANEAASSASAQKPSGGPSSYSQSSSFQSGTSNNQQQDSSRSSYGRSSSYSAAPPPPPPMTGSGTQQRRLFLYHLAVLLLAFVHVFPFVPLYWSRKAYTLLMQLSLLGQGYKLYLRYGVPKISPLTALQDYMVRAVPANDFYILVVSFSFMSHAPMTMVLAPIVLASLFGVFNYLANYHRSNPLWQKYGTKLHAALQRRTQEVHLASAASEILVGAFLIMNLFTVRRNILLTFAFWNLLKMRYHVSEASAFHKQAWRSVEIRTATIRSKLPAPLQNGMNFVIKWFTTPQ